MSRDKGGAATVAGLMRVLAERKIPGLRVVAQLGMVRNSIGEESFVSDEIITARSGVRVRIGNTDAEGRLVLADALALAGEERPALVVSLATLTGAARVALGPDVPPFFTDDEGLAAAVARAAETEADPLWRLPFWAPYEPLIEPGIADLDNAPSGGMAGAVTAALFLRRFAGTGPYLHLDIYGWTPAAKPGRPKGGACQGARALLAVLEERFCSTT